MTYTLTVSERSIPEQFSSLLSGLDAYQDAVKRAPDGVVILTNEFGTVLICNDRAQEMC